MQSEEYHETVHQDPEDGKWHGLTHDVTILTLHVAGCRSNGDALRREQFTTLGAGTVGGCQPVGFVARNTEERRIVHQSEVAGCSCLQLTEEDIGIRGTTRNKGSDRTDKGSKEREEGSGERHKSLGNVVRHTGVVHQHGHSDKAADGDSSLLEVDSGFS